MKLDINISIDFLWGDEHFEKDDWGEITYIVGPNGTGKTIFAERLKEQFKSNGLKVRYFGAERLSNLGNKWDDHGFLQSDQLSQGLNMGQFDSYKNRADVLGQSIDALIELRNKLDLQIKIESVLFDIFGKSLSFKEEGGFLNITLSDSGKIYDLRKSESHGLKEIITLLTFLYDDEYNCIILDEPELNLHPQFQQFILQEIKNIAGNPYTDSNKKMFVILTHSPYMLNIQNDKELKNLIVFHRHKLPKYISDYDSLEKSQLERLNRLLLRLNVNHKTMFFADKPIFVEGYIDQQFLNDIQNKRKVPLGAEGITIIDVGGKEEVDIMYTLCNLLEINAFCIIDMDGLFEGKIRRSVEKNPDVDMFMANKGKNPLNKTIGEMERLLNDLVKEFRLLGTTSVKEELKDFLVSLQAQTGDKARIMEKRIMFLAIRRISEQIIPMLSEEGKRKLIQVEALVKDIFECFNSVNVYFLEKGEIENYYITFKGNQYQIDDNKKTSYYLDEYAFLNEIDFQDIEKYYRDIVAILDKICSVAIISTEKFLSAKIGDWIHCVQSVMRMHPDISIEELENNPRTDWKSYKRIIEIIDLKKSDTGFVCKFKILKNLVTDEEKVFEFNENTVPANYVV